MSILDLDGRVFLVTGANTGIGRVTARELAGRGARVFLACRTPEKAAHAVDEIRRLHGAARAEALHLDLASLASVRACAERFLGLGVPLHGLVNNAGVGGPRGQTSDGFELAFGINHMGHFLLTELLLPRLRASAPARVVTVASQSHYKAKGIDFEAVRRPTKTVAGLREYEVSKLANVLFTSTLAQRLEGSGVTTYSVHPGVIASDIWRRIPWPVRPLMARFMKSTAEGAETSLYCATSAEAAEQTGLYYDTCRPVEPSGVAKDAALAAELWRRSESWCERLDA
jgi:NAD(P)-dependent dehydrogenase (short-subunit alcohol dehydrogenase family)